LFLLAKGIYLIIFKIYETKDLEISSFLTEILL